MAYGNARADLVDTLVAPQAALAAAAALEGGWVLAVRLAIAEPSDMAGLLLPPNSSA